MKRISLLVLLTVLLNCVSMSALNPVKDGEVKFRLHNGPIVLSAPEVSPLSTVAHFRQVRLGKSTMAAAATSVKEGNYVMTYQTLNKELAPAGGSGVSFSSVEGSTGTYLIKDFFGAGYGPIKIEVNQSAGTFSVASQQLTTDASVGRIDVAYCNSDGTPDYTKSLEGVVNADGSLTIESWWGIYVNDASSEYNGKSAGLYYSTTFTPANATMTSTPADGTAAETYGVYVSEKENVVSVLNFANHGQTVNVVVNGDRSGTIAQQVAMVHATQGNVYTAAYTSASGNSINISSTITLNKAEDLRTLSWNNWTIYNSNGYFNLWSGATISTDFDIVYPEVSTSLSGSGTKDDPYKVGKLADLNYLASLCESDATAGKYYALTADIDLSGYKFAPIGSVKHPFAGEFDGAGYKFVKLTIDGSSDGYAALFAVASKGSVIKNVVLDSPTVSGAGNYTAGVVAYSEGEVSGCRVASATIGSDYAYVAGVAAYAKSITDCEVATAQVVGLGGYVGGLVAVLNGNISGSSAEDVFVVAGASTSGIPSGGLVAAAQEGSTISDSHFSGMVSGSASTSVGQTLGGVVGEAYKTDIARCFSVADIMGYTSDAIVGGIAGHFAGTITDSYSAGRVTSSLSTNVGGLVGNVDTSIESTLSTSFTTAVVTASTTSYDKATGCRELVGNYATANAKYANLVYDSNMTSSIGSQVNGASTSQFVAETGLTGYSADTWSFTKGYYPRLKSQATSAAALLGATAIEFGSNDNLLKLTANTTVNTLSGVVPAFVNNGAFSATGHGATLSMKNQEGTAYTISLNGEYATDTLAVFTGNVQYIMYVVKTAPKVFEGEGTADSPYLIRTKDELVSLAKITSESRQPFNGSYFLMTNDIDMAGVTDFPGIGCQAFSTAVTFGGVFDGGNHAIHNLVTSNIVWTTAPTDSANSWKDGVYASIGQPSAVALFGTIASSAKVCNLTLASDCSFDGGSYVAGFAVTNNGTIENCINNARIRSLKGYGAGIVVTNYGTVDKCLNTGNILVNSSYASGIVCNNGGVISNVMNTGDVSSMTLASKADDSQFRYSAGIVSYSAGRKVVNAVNAGTIYSEKGDCGGIAGYYPSYGTGTGYNELENVINYGIVNGTTATVTGAIVGTGSTSGSVKNVYWDHQILPIMADANSAHEGMSGVTTKTLTSGSALEGFDSDTWVFAANAYPVLKIFASEDAVKNASQAVVTLADGETVKNVISDATLATVDGATWRLSNASAFAVEGGKLKAPASVTTKVTDTLTVTIGVYAKAIVISRTPTLNLAGSGLKDDPYQVATVNDWNTLANYVIDTQLDMAGDYVAIMNDIDFTDATFTPIGKTTEIWNGNLMGNGKTLANITYTFTTSNTKGAKVGAIRALGAEGTISDLSISGTFTSATSNYAAVFVGEHSGKIENCVNLATINSSKPYFAGFASIAHEGAQFIDCVNRGTVSGSSTAGYGSGIVSETDGYVSFLRCGNEGVVTTSGTGTYYGGLAGKIFPASFVECYNKSDITNNVSFYGGLVGNATSSAAYKDRPFVFDRCYNTGNLTTKGNVAGILANAASSNCVVTAYDCYNTGDIKATGVNVASGLFNAISGAGGYIKNCWNSGNITSENSKTSVAGVVGKTQSATAAAPIHITNCYNTGKITSAAALAGGISYQPAAYTIYENCYNLGDVSAATYDVGGIVANVIYTGIEINNCWNAGNISTGTNRAGGIIGTSSTVNISVSDCANFGAVSTSNTKKGTTDTGTATTATGHAIGGIAGQSGGTFTRCYNVGTVTGANLVGGIVGRPYTSKSTATTQVALKLSDSYNIGSVVADADVSGAIVGCAAEVNDDTKDLYWSDNTSVTNTYYLEGVSASTLTAAGTKVTVAELAGKDMGAGWTTADSYSYPALDSIAELDVAAVNAAAVVLADGDTPELVKQSFHVGHPVNVTWTASLTSVSVEGNNVVLPEGNTTGKLVLTATAGEYSKSTELNLDVATSINDIEVDGNLVVESEVYFNLNGVMVSPDSVGNGTPYIVVRTYSNGTSRAFKVLR